MEGGSNLLGKLLAKLNAPLVERVKPPDRALDKHDVLVERDELAHRVRVELDAKDGRSRAVAGEAARRHHPLGRTLRANLIGGLTKGKRLGLGEEVGEEQLVHVLLAVLGRVGRVHKGDEVRRDEVRSLVNELVEGVLAVGARLAPEDLAS